MTSYVFRFDSQGGESWARPFEFASDAAAKLEAAVMLENQARVARRTGTLTVERRTADGAILLGKWTREKDHAEWAEPD